MNITENIFKENNIKMILKMSFIQANIQDIGFNHISFRKQIFINPDTSKILNSFIITHDDIQYRIFVSTNFHASYVNKRFTGDHIVNQCNNNESM